MIPQPARGESRRTGVICLLSIFAAALALFGCTKKEAEVEPVVSVQVEAAKRGEISETVSADAVVYPVEQAVITPKITSTIKTFEVQRGSRVKKGQLLAVLENADLAAAADQSKGEFQQAEAGYTTATGASIPQELQKATLDAAVAKSTFDAQQKVYDSRKTLFDQGALPRRDFDTAEVALAQARNQYEVAQRQLDDLKRIGQEQSLKSATGQLGAAKGKYLGAEAQLSYSEIRSPIDGVITDRPLYPGELATANAPLLTVMNNSKLIAKAHLSQAEALRLKVGDEAELAVPGLDQPVQARVSLVSPAVDAGSTTIEVWFEVPKPNPALRPGMTVAVTATAKTSKDALTVPTSAVFKNADGTEYVLLAGSDDKAHQKTVKTGIRNAEDVQIEDGIKEGDSVIVSGGYGVPDKTEIKIETAPAPEAPAADDKDKGADDKAADDKAGADKPADKGKE
ncbi:MAG TPA: efflux RND transporter periplasmic adaptor subunit [Candidatus Acidoferrales bacterium]